MRNANSPSPLTCSVEGRRASVRWPLAACAVALLGLAGAGCEVLQTVLGAPPPPPVQPPLPGPAASELTATVVVDAGRVVREVPPELFGTNIEWRWNGNFVWDEASDALDPEMVRLTRDMGVRLIRYPGGVYSDAYHWRDGVGPRKQRPTVAHEPGKDERSRPNFGTDEALAFADAVGAELMITVNAGSGTAEEAADWVRYVNRDGLRVRFWEVGNELYINSGDVFSSTVHVTPDEYADRYLRFAEAMRRADPRITIGAIGGENEGRYRIVSDPRWNQVVLRRAGHAIDFLSVHNAYAPVIESDPTDVRAVYEAMFAAPLRTARNLRTLAAQIRREAPDHADRIFIAVTEWGPFFRPTFQSAYIDHHKTLGSTIASAAMFKTLLESDATGLAAFWHLSDVSALGWIGSTSNAFPADPVWAPTAKHHMFRMFSVGIGPRLLGVRTTCPTFDTRAVGYTDAQSGVPFIDALAAQSASGDRTQLLLVNKSIDAAARVDVQLVGATPDAAAERTLLTGRGLTSHTGTRIIDVPGLNVVPQAGVPAGVRGGPGLPTAGAGDITFTRGPFEASGAFTVVCPPLSVTRIDLATGGPKR